MMNTRMSVLFLVPYPLRRAPSQRYRVEQFLPLLDRRGIFYRVEPFFTEEEGKLLYRYGSGWQKAINVIRGFGRRFWLLITGLKGYGYIFIHREAAPLGPPVIEWVLTKVLRKKIIYDFDDAIWVPDISSNNLRIQWIKCHWKVKYICRWSFKVVCGNEFLYHFAKQYSHSVVRIPTVVNTESEHNILKDHKSGLTVVGWTGSHSTLKYLNSLVPLLRRLQQHTNFCFLVIADNDPKLPLSNYKFITWSADREIEDLLRIDIGVMPLVADEWSEGKCGFKLIQYLSLGIPSLASPVGVNTQIIKNAENGYLCSTDIEWEIALTRLINSFELRKQMGAKGRDLIIEKFSLLSVKEKFISIFDN